MRQTEQSLRCPYCGERITVLVDHSVDVQTYIEDCEVCCRPITLTVAKKKLPVIVGPGRKF